MSLYQRKAHDHVPKNVNDLSKKDFSTTLADWAGTTICIYLFACIGIGSLIGIITRNALLAGVCGALSSYFIQLVFLPIIQKRSNDLNRRSEIQTDEQYQTTVHVLHEVNEIHNHEDEQDKELIQQTKALNTMIDHMQKLISQNNMLLVEVIQLHTQLNAMEKRQDSSHSSIISDIVHPFRKREKQHVK